MLRRWKLVLSIGVVAVLAVTAYTRWIYPWRVNEAVVAWMGIPLPPSAVIEAYYENLPVEGGGFVMVGFHCSKSDFESFVRAYSAQGCGPGPLTQCAMWKHGPVPPGTRADVAVEEAQTVAGVRIPDLDSSVALYWPQWIPTDSLVLINPEVNRVWNVYHSRR